jgi:hypothetical protein
LNVECFSFQQPRPVQRRQKIPFHAGELPPGDGISRDEDEFDRPRDFMLVPPEAFAEQPPRAAAFHGAADLFAGDDAEFWACAAGQLAPIGDEAALRKPLTLLPDAREIAAPGEPRSAAQSQTFRRFHGHDRIKRASGVCGLRGGGCAAWRVRPGWICGQGTRAAVSGAFSLVDTGVS